jgi:hypothetical protein
MQSPDRHVAAVGGVADVDRVEQQTAGEIAAAQLVAHPFQPVAAQSRQVGQWNIVARLGGQLGGIQQ